MPGVAASHEMENVKVTQVKFDRKKYLDELAVTQGCSCDSPFDPEDYSDEDMDSNRSADTPRDCDATWPVRKRDRDEIRDSDRAHLDSYEHSYLLCRGVSWT